MLFVVPKYYTIRYNESKRTLRIAHLFLNSNSLFHPNGLHLRQVAIFCNGERRRRLRVRVVRERVGDAGAAAGAGRCAAGGVGGRLDAAHLRRPVHVRADPRVGQLLPDAALAHSQCTSVTLVSLYSCSLHSSAVRTCIRIRIPLVLFDDDVISHLSRGC